MSDFYKIETYAGGENKTVVIKTKMNGDIPDETSKSIFGVVHVGVQTQQGMTAMPFEFQFPPEASLKDAFEKFDEVAKDAFDKFKKEKEDENRIITPGRKNKNIVVPNRK